MTISARNRILWILIALATSSCGWWEYYPEFVCRSPDGQAEVRVMRNLPAFAGDYKFRVEVSTGSGTTVIYEHQRQSAIGLVEIHWSPDNKQFGLLICNRYSGPLWISYDLARNRPLSLATFRSILEQQLRRKYRIAVDVDVVQWACSSRGSAAYRKQE